MERPGAKLDGAAADGDERFAGPRRERERQSARVPGFEIFGDCAAEDGAGANPAAVIPINRDTVRAHFLQARQMVLGHGDAAVPSLAPVVVRDLREHQAHPPRRPALMHAAAGIWLADTAENEASARIEPEGAEDGMGVPGALFLWQNFG